MPRKLVECLQVLSSAPAHRAKSGLTPEPLLLLESMTLLGLGKKAVEPRRWGKITARGAVMGTRKKRMKLKSLRFGSWMPGHLSESKGRTF